MDNDPFAPLRGGAGPARAASSSGEWVCVAPVPDDAPDPPAARGHRGKPSQIWEYRDAAGRLLGFACRFDPDGKPKEFHPLALHRHVETGALEWRWKSWPAPRPLYGLDHLAARPDAPVLICEGEKAVDAARRLAPDHVVVTSPNGSKSAGKADWSALRGRTCVIWPDADDAGKIYAKAVASELAKVGAVCVGMVPLPVDVGDGWDAADAEGRGMSAAEVAKLIAAARIVDDDTKGRTTGDQGDDDKGSGKRPTQRDTLIALVDDVLFWHSPDGVAYATIPFPTHRENWKVRSQRFRQFLSVRAVDAMGTKIPGGQAVEDALRYFEAIAFKGPERKPYLRTADLGRRWYLDLCDDRWRVIEFRENGWSVLDKHDVPFVRAPAMRPLPVPESGDVIEAMRGFVNVASDDDFMLVLAWVLAALAPRGPYPILIVQGEQGSGKSTFTQLLRSLIDPNVAPIRAPPEKIDDLIIAAKNGHVIALDNLSKVDASMSDALCRISTGGGISTRVLYSDEDEHVIWVRNPIALNGIPSLADRPDLASRAIIIHLKTIDEASRRPEDEFYADWEKARPAIMGAFCDALVRALKNLPHVRLTGAPRMADFMKLITAAEGAFGWERGAFAGIYNDNRRDLDAAAFDADPIAQAIFDFYQKECTYGPWTGTATGLLARLNQEAGDTLQRSMLWPKGAQALGNRIERVKPLLRARGVVIERRHSGERTITIAAKSE